MKVKTPQAHVKQVRTLLGSKCERRGWPGATPRPCREEVIFERASADLLYFMVFDLGRVVMDTPYFGE